MGDATFGFGNIANFCGYSGRIIGRKKEYKSRGLGFHEFATVYNPSVGLNYIDGEMYGRWVFTDALTGAVRSGEGKFDMIKDSYWTRIRW